MYRRSSLRELPEDRIQMHMEAYRSGHNGPDSKAARFRHSVQRESSCFLAKAPFSCGFRDFGLQEKEKAPYSCLSKFAQKSNTERYRRGHNGADSKSVCVKAHMGSNPILSATYGVGSNIPAPFSVEKLCPV